MADNPTYQELEQRVKSLEAQIEANRIDVQGNRPAPADPHRLFFELTGDAVFIFQEGKIINPNPAARELHRALGAELERALKTHCVCPGGGKASVRSWDDGLRGERRRNICQFRIASRTGGYRWLEVNTVRIEWEGRPATLNALREITEYKKAELRYYERKKIEAVQTLAGGMAHAYNNLLMGVQGTSSLMSLDIGPRHRHYEHLKRIEYCVEEMAKLTSQLVGFARCGKYEERWLSLNEVLGEISDLFVQTRKEIRLTKHLQGDLWPVKGDQGQIEQVVVDILLNAWQAMPGAGEICLKTENVVVNQHLGPHTDCDCGHYVKITITDSGQGMDENVQEKIFEPFFTTQNVRPGKGLGLASVYGIIKNHNGYIDVESHIGEGSTFTILLPAMAAEAEAMMREAV